MTEKRRKTIVFGLLIVAVIWGIWNNPFSSKQKPAAARSDSAVLADRVGATQSIAAMATTADRLDLTSWLADPFSRKQRRSATRTTVIAKKTELRVSVISWQDDRYMAVVNGKVVQQGDTIDGWRVNRIDEFHVLLTRGAENLKLTMKRS